jgi:hypothetical protein
MRLIISFLTLFLIPFLCNGQSRTITGKVVDESDFASMPEVKIQSRDGVVIGTTDINGNFKIEVPQGINELRLIYIGMEPTSIKIPENCGNLEIIMMVDVIYDYTTVNKINKKRCKLFKKLPDKHRQAFEKGIFTSSAPCFTYIFHKH